MKKIIISIIAILGLFQISFASVMIKPEDRNFDFKDAVEGQKIKHNFILFNNTDKPIKILNVKTA